MLARGGKKPVNHRRRWTKRDDRQLLYLWETGLRLSAIANRMGRTRLSIRENAYRLGLAMGCPPGFEYLTAAALRVGFSNVADLRRVLERAGVRIHMVLTVSRRRRWRRHFVDPEAVNAAMARWSQSEPISAAARRLGVSQPALREWLIAAGIPDPRTSPRGHWRVTEDEVKRALAQCKRPYRVGVKHHRSAA
jgi:excisionase family DNA binding protein